MKQKENEIADKCTVIHKSATSTGANQCTKENNNSIAQKNQKSKKNFITYDGEALMSMPFEPTKFIIDKLIA